MRICCSSRHMLLDFIHLSHIVKVEYDVIFVVYLLHFYSSIGFRHFMLMCLLDICLLAPQCQSLHVKVTVLLESLGSDALCSSLPFLLLLFVSWEMSLHWTTWREIFFQNLPNINAKSSFISTSKLVNRWISPVC